MFLKKGSFHIPLTSYGDLKYSNFTSTITFKKTYMVCNDIV